jgi:hypothetical protein
MSPTGVATAAILLDRGSSKAAHWFAKRANEPTAATTAAWSPADRSSPKREFGRTARPAGPDIGIPGRDRPARAGARLSSLSIRDRPTVNASRALSRSPEISTLDRHPHKGDRCNPLEFGEQVMPEYRMYTVDYNCHRVDAKNVECVDDHEAIQQALRSITSFDVEVWQLDRFVGLLPRYEKAPPKSTKHRSRRS